MDHIVLYAIDKNEMAVNTLLHAKKTRWQEKVSVVCTDMRTWEPSEEMDIIVSELLGSFGDNELSPECLDGAQRYLARKLYVLIFPFFTRLRLLLINVLQ